MSSRVAILFNEEHGLTRGTAADAVAVSAVIRTARSVEAACRSRGLETVLLPAPDEPRDLLAALDRVAPEAVFNLVETFRGDSRLEAAAAWMLELSGVPYTGSPPLALSLALDKPTAKVLLAARGVRVPEGRVIESEDDPIDGLRFPVIVKPSREDASHGITLDSVVHDETAARAKVRHLVETYGEPALVEEFIEGREINASVLGTGPRARVLPLGEIDFAGFPPGRPRLVTYRAKWDEESEEYRGTASVAASGLSAETERAIAGMALAAYRAMGLRDYGRVDFRLHPTEGPFVLEVNPNPDIAPDAGLALAAARGGMRYEDLVADIVDAALARGAVPHDR